MLHVRRPRHAPPGPPRTALPALLLGVGAVAFGGLATAPAPPGPVQRQTAPVAQASAAGPAELVTERSLRRDRASRDRATRGRPVAPAAAASKPAAAPKPVAPAVKATHEPPAAAAKPTAAAAVPAPPVKPVKPVKPARAKPVAPAKPTAAPARREQIAPVTATRSSGRCPVPSASFTDTYGAPRPGGRSHLGTDLMAAHGAPVYAVTSGVVDVSSSRSGGLSLSLRSDGGERYFYAHNSANLVRDGQRVGGGDLIARVGNTGNARGTDPHVHFERQVGGRSLNPYDLLRRLCR